MKKLIKILLLTLVYSAVNASSEKVDLAIKLIDDKYTIRSGCAFIGEKSIRGYFLQFKSKDFISRINTDLENNITLDTDIGEIKPSAAGIENSILTVAIDEKDLKKLFNYSKTLTVNLNPYLIE